VLGNRVKGRSGNSINYATSHSMRSDTSGPKNDAAGVALRKDQVKMQQQIEEKSKSF